DALRSPGQPLESATRAPMDPRFGHNFGQVRVHADSRAAADPNRKPPDVEVEDDEFEGVEGVGAARRPVEAGAIASSGPEQTRSGAFALSARTDRLPHQGSATIVCDGAGGYRVHLGWAATYGCGIAGCVRQHEESHIADWQGRWPNGCKNADGTAKPDGSRVPTGGAGYDAFLRRSECTAYTGEVPCEETLLAGASAACRPRVQAVLNDTRRQKTAYCGA
ncbi:MAG: eCIS core domain-containing protein, partial [Chloroflexota bacterium]